MRFIHTADWHLGNAMHGIDRTEEINLFLNWLKQQIIDKGAEALVVAGDIFDVANPSNEAKKSYYKFLASLLETDCRNIIIVGGNHDSGALLDASRELLEFLNIKVVGNITGLRMEDLVCEMKGKDDSVIGICAAVPYVREFELRDYVTDKDAVFADNANKGLYKAVLEAAEKVRNGREIPMITTGHLYATGLEGRPDNDTGEGMKEHGIRDIVGNLGTVTLSVFPEAFDYVALGHIHYTTRVSGNPKVRYSGSPFVLGFDEARMDHSILVVDTEIGKEPVIEKINVPKYFRFRRVKGSVDEIKEQLQEIKQSFDGRPTKVEIVYEFQPGMKIREVLSTCLENANFEVVNWKATTGKILTASEMSDEALDDIKTIGEEEVFKLLIQKNNSEKTEDEQKELFKNYWPMFEQLMREVEEDTNSIK